MRVNIICMSLFIVLIFSSCGMKTERSLINNYEGNSKKILDLKEYFNKIIPKGFIVRIRYNSSENIDLFVYEPATNKGELEKLFGQWNINFKDYKETPTTEYEKKYYGKTKSLSLVKEKLKWTNKTFIELYNKLDDINCIGISNGYQTEIEYGFKGMGALSYLIFDKRLNKELQKKYSDDCMFLFYKENIVLAYSSGAIGSFCTPEFKSKKILLDSKN